MNYLNNIYDEYFSSVTRDEIKQKLKDIISKYPTDEYPLRHQKRIPQLSLKRYRKVLDIIKDNDTYCDDFIKIINDFNVRELPYNLHGRLGKAISYFISERYNNTEPIVDSFIGSKQYNLDVKFYKYK